MHDLPPFTSYQSRRRCCWWCIVHESYPQKYHLLYIKTGRRVRLFLALCDVICIPSYSITEYYIHVLSDMLMATGVKMFNLIDIVS